MARTGLAQVLARCSGLKLHAALCTVEEVQADPHPPDVLLVGGGPEGLGPRLRRLREAAPGVRVVLVSPDGTGRALPADLVRHVHGVLADPTPERLERVVQAVRSGLYYLDGPVPWRVWRQAHAWRSGPELRPVEVLALRLVAEGRTNAEIARELGCSEAAVKAMLRSVMRKMGATNRAQAAALAVRWGLVD